jgi:hypothetical protein
MSRTTWARFAASWVVGLVALAIAAVVVFSLAMDEAADDLRLQVRDASGLPLETPRTFHGSWLSAHIAADIQPTNYAAMFSRADELDHRADRIREIAGAASLAGLVLVVATASPDATRTRDRTRPLASTKSNGTV